MRAYREHVHMHLGDEPDGSSEVADSRLEKSYRAGRRCAPSQIGTHRDHMTEAIPTFRNASFWQQTSRRSGGRNAAAALILMARK